MSKKLKFFKKTLKDWQVAFGLVLVLLINDFDFLESAQQIARESPGFSIEEHIGQNGSTPFFRAG